MVHAVQDQPVYLVSMLAKTQEVVVLIELGDVTLDGLEKVVGG